MMMARAKARRRRPSSPASIQVRARIVLTVNVTR